MSLKMKALNGMKWNGISTVFITIIQFIQMIILARFLSPVEFGLMGMIVVVTGFAQAFVDAGMSNAIIQRQKIDDKELSSLYWLNIFVGLLIFGLILLIRPMIIAFYSEPGLNTPLLWVAFNFLIIPIGQQFQAIFQKELEFNKLASIEMISTTFGVTLSIMCALNNFGVLALVFGQLATSFVKSIILVFLGIKKWRPKLVFKWAHIKGFMSFGLFQMGEKIVNYFSSNIDYLLIGRYLGAEALGVYTLAYQLVIMPLMKINPVITKVAFPVFSKIQQNVELVQKGYLQVTKLLVFLTFPLLIGLGITAKFVIPLFYGGAWGESILILQLLIPLGLLKVIGNPSGSIFLAKGRADIGFKWNTFTSITNLLVFYVIIQHGLVLITIVHVFLVLIYFVFLQWLVNSQIKLTWKQYFGSISIPVIASINMLILLVLINNFVLEFLIEKELIILILNVLLGMFIYIFSIYKLDKLYIKDFIKLVLRKGDI